MNTFVAFIVLSILIEKLAEVVKAAISPGKLPAWGWFFITAVLGMLLCILFNVNVFTELGFVSETSIAVIVGQIITGIAAGSGSNFVHDLIRSLKQVNTSLAEKTDDKNTTNDDLRQ